MKRCECRECDNDNCGGRGPAAYAISRDGKRLLVCTRCICTGDEVLETLVTTRAELEECSEWDQLGGSCLSQELEAKWSTN